MKITKNMLQKLIREEVTAKLVKVAPVVQTDVVPKSNTQLHDAMRNYIASLRALYLWFHGAHHSAKGTGFVGDHATIFSDIYDQLIGDYDTAVEKAIGFLGDETMSCPIHVTQDALAILKTHPSPAGKREIEILEGAISFLEEHYNLLTETYESLEGSDNLPLGLNDYLTGAANEYDTFLYLLKQRVKENMN